MASAEENAKANKESKLRCKRVIAYMKANSVGLLAAYKALYPERVNGNSLRFDEIETKAYQRKLD